MKYSKRVTMATGKIKTLKQQVNNLKVVERELSEYLKDEDDPYTVAAKTKAGSHGWPTNTFPLCEV